MDQRLNGLTGYKARTDISTDRGFSYRSQRYFDTLLLPCPICGVTRHKHEVSCPHYHSIHPGRCWVKHTFSLRASGPTVNRVRPNTYCCQLCNMAEFTVNFELKTGPHPLCLKGEHNWMTCGDGCCKPWCSGCGLRGTWDNLVWQRYVIDQWEK